MEGIPQIPNGTLHIRLPSLNDDKWGSVFLIVWEDTDKINVPIWAPFDNSCAH